MILNLFTIQMLNSELQTYIESDIIPQYAAFDKGHNIDHVQKVIEDSLLIGKEYDVDANMVYTIAAYHDIGMPKGRENHHIISGVILRNDKNLLQWFNDEQLLIMQQAVEDHRASNKHEPRSIYGKIVAEADRDISVEKIIYRSIAYGVNKHPEENKEQLKKRVHEHLRTKYGEGGYLQLWLNTKKNRNGLKEVRTVINNENKYQAAFERIYKEFQD